MGHFISTENRMKITFADGEWVEYREFSYDDLIKITKAQKEQGDDADVLNMLLLKTALTSWSLTDETGKVAELCEENFRKLKMETFQTIVESLVSHINPTKKDLGLSKE